MAQPPPLPTYAGTCGQCKFAAPHVWKGNLTGYGNCPRFDGVALHGPDDRVRMPLLVWHANTCPFGELK